MKESSPNGWKTLWEKEKLLVTSKRHVLQTRKNQGLFGKGLNTQRIHQNQKVSAQASLPGLRRLT